MSSFRALVATHSSQQGGHMLTVLSIDRKIQHKSHNKLRRVQFMGQSICLHMKHTGQSDNGFSYVSAPLLYPIYSLAILHQTYSTVLCLGQDILPIPP